MCIFELNVANENVKRFLIINIVYLSQKQTNKTLNN